MTGIERALRALNFEPTDRVPIMGGFLAHAEIMREVTGLDPFAEPQRTAIETARRLGADVIIQVVVPKRKQDSTTMPGGRESLFTARAEPTPYGSPEDVVAHVRSLPPPEQVRRDFDFEAYYEHIVEGQRAGQEACGDDILWLQYAAARDCPFMYYSQFGYENYYMALALYPEQMARLFRHGAEHSRCCNEVVAQAVTEGRLRPFVYMGQDICDNRGPMISLEMLDRLYFPCLRHCLEPLNEADVRIIWHSDGNINPIIERLLDCGIDGFQGLQEDRHLPPEQTVRLDRLAKMRARTGRPLILFGSVSVRDVLPRGSEDEVRADVQRCIDAAGRRGGFVLAPTSTAGPDIPRRNIYVFYEHGIRYGRAACLPAQTSGPSKSGPQRRTPQR